MPSFQEISFVLAGTNICSVQLTKEYIAPCSLVIWDHQKTSSLVHQLLLVHSNGFGQQGHHLLTDLAKEGPSPIDLPIQKAKLLSVENLKTFFFLKTENFYTTQHQNAGDFLFPDQLCNRMGLIALITDSHWHILMTIIDSCSSLRYGVIIKKQTWFPYRIQYLIF